MFWGLFTPPIHRRDVVSRQVRNEVKSSKEEEFDSMSGPRIVVSRINEINSGQPTSKTPVLLGDTPENENASVTDILPLPFTCVCVLDVHVLHSETNTMPQIFFSHCI